MHGIADGGQIRMTIPDEVLDNNNAIMRGPKQRYKLLAYKLLVTRIIVKLEMLLSSVHPTLFYLYDSQCSSHERLLSIRRYISNVTRKTKFMIPAWEVAH